MTPVRVRSHMHTHSLCDSVSLRLGPVAWRHQPLWEQTWVTGFPTQEVGSCGFKGRDAPGAGFWFLSLYRQLGVNSSAPQFVQTQRGIGGAHSPGDPAPSSTGKWARWRWGWAGAPGLCLPEREAQLLAVTAHVGLAELPQNLGLHAFKPKARVDIKDSSQVRTKILAPHVQRLREKTPCCLPKPTVPFHAIHETLLHDRPHSPRLRDTQEAGSAPPLPSVPATPTQRYTGWPGRQGGAPGPVTLQLLSFTLMASGKGAGLTVAVLRTRLVSILS